MSWADPRTSGSTSSGTRREVIVDEVHHHWIVYLLPLVEAALGLLLLIAVGYVDLDLGWVPFLLALVIWLHAAWKALGSHRDRFVVDRRAGVPRQRRALAGPRDDAAEPDPRHRRHRAAARPRARLRASSSIRRRGARLGRPVRSAGPTSAMSPSGGLKFSGPGCAGRGLELAQAPVHQAIDRRIASRAPPCRRRSRSRGGRRARR